MILHPFVLVGSFLIGIVPAALAGLLYCVLALLLVQQRPRAVISVWCGSLLGALAGAAGTSAFIWQLLRDNPNFIAKLTELVPIGTVSGLLCGLVAGYLFPVGKAHPELAMPNPSNVA
jgi:hypothetical protein